MADGDCNYIKGIDFGEGFEHIRKIDIDGKVIYNSGYTYCQQEETILIPIKEILSAV